MPGPARSTGTNYINLTSVFNNVTQEDSLDELLDELDSNDDLDKAQQRISIDVDKRQYGKAVTVVSGFNLPESEIESLASSLKSSLAAGGTVTDGTIEIQGDHRDRLPELLQGHGYEL